MAIVHAVSLEVALQAAHESSEAPERLSLIAHDIQYGRGQIRHALQHYQQVMNEC